MAGLQVVGRIQGGHTENSLSTPRASSSPSPSYPHHISFCSSWLPIFLLPEEFFWAPSVKVLGSGAEKVSGIRMCYLHPELSCLLSLCLCNVIAKTSLIHGGFYPYFILLYVGAKVWGRMNLKMLPSWCLCWDADLYCIWNFGCMLLAGPGIDQSCLL